MDAISDTSLTRSGQTQGRSILVVDDNELLRDVISAVLAREGCRVTPCPDGMSAVVRANEDVFDTILIDYSMPGLNGATATEMLRERHLQVNIIGMSMDDRNKEFLAAGADAFLAKPFALDDMLSLLKITRSPVQDRESRKISTALTDPLCR